MVPEWHELTCRFTSARATDDLLEYTGAAFTSPHVFTG